MGDDRKDSRRRRHHHNLKEKEEKTWTTPTVLLARNDNDRNYKTKNADISKLHSVHENSSQPTIILKTRDGETRALSPNQSHVSSVSKQKKESELYNVAIKSKIVLSKAPNSSHDLLSVPVMTRSMCLIEDGIFTGDGVLDYLTEHNEFLVVGCLGLQGVGKSMVMSELCGYFEDKKEIFKTQNTENLLMCSHCTSTFDLFVSKNRIFFLDTPPLLSPSLMDKMIYQESKKTPFSSSSSQSFSGGSQLSSGDFSNTENALEIMSLQTAAFLLSVCHVVLLVQDWFYDPNILRFLQTAEMLKPPMPTTSHNEELIEYFPHVIFLHNKARYSDFTQTSVSMMQDAYNQTFLRSRLQIQSGIGIASGSVINHLNSCSCGEPINLYMLPDTNLENEKEFVNGHPGFHYLLEKLKRDVFGIPKNPLTHAPLSEKNWFHYSSKVWEAIKNSSFFHEYDRLLSKHE